MTARLLLVGLAVIACGLAVSVRASDPTTSLPGILDLDSSNFDEHVTGAKHVLVEFYAPWCGHCKKLVPEYKLLGEAVMKDPELKDRVAIAKVNADADKDLGKRFGVRGFPTIKYFGRAKPVAKPDDYTGGRTSASFISFLKDRLKADEELGRVKAMDALASRFVASDDKAEVLKEAAAAAAGLEGQEGANAEMYVKIMKKALDKGEGYYAAEKERVSSILLTGSMASDRMADMSRKVSILNAFLPKAAAEQ